MEINRVNELPQNAVEEFWGAVKDSLSMLGGDPAQADPIRKNFESLIDTPRDREYLMFFHEDPLWVAAQMLDTRPTEHQTKLYLDILRLKCPTLATKS